MKRWVAILLLSVTLVFLGATSADPCAEVGQDNCAPICHVYCADGCSLAVVPEPPATPAPDPMPGLVYERTGTRAVLCIELEPEKEPPRI